MVDGKIRAVKGFFTTTTYLWLVLLIGLSVRLYALSHLYVINTDSVYYIYQARAVSAGMWDAAKSCGYGFVSLYPFVVVIFQKVFDNWVLSAQLVSIAFGVLTIAPLYFLMKRFFPDTVAALVALAFALNPFFVKESVDVMKDPVYWFLAVLGLFLFVKAAGERKNIFFFMSSLSLCLAGLARVEALFLFAGSLLYLVSIKERRIKQIAAFSVPLIVLALITLGSLFISRDGHSLWSVYFQPRLQSLSYLKYVSGPFNTIAAKLEALDNEHIGGIPGNFFIYIKMNLWLVALGILMSKIVSAAYFPFAALAVLGMRGIRDEARQKPLIKYLLFAAAFSLIILYAFTFMIWIMERRYTAIVVFPASILIGFGIQRIKDSFTRKGLKESLAVLILAFLIIIVTVPGNLRPVREDKLPYRQIGEFIAADAGGRITRIATASLWVPFYAHAMNTEVVCPKPTLEYWELPLKSYPEFMEVLKREGMEYFLWEEDQWRGGSYDFLQVVSPHDMTEIGSWTISGHKMVLFKLTGS